MAKTAPHRGSHLPALMRAVELTNGPIFELGCGMYSSPFLHWKCYPTARQLVTFEDKPQWFEFIKQFETPWHRTVLVEDWGALDLSGVCSVALVDHDPVQAVHTRSGEVAKLQHAEYVVCHDAENRSDYKYKYNSVRNLFKWRWKYTAAYPYTWVFSNRHDLTEFRNHEAFQHN